MSSASTNETGPEELEHQHSSTTDIIEEESSDDGLSGVSSASAADDFKSPKNSDQVCLQLYGYNFGNSIVNMSD